MSAFSRALRSCAFALAALSLVAAAPAAIARSAAAPCTAAQKPLPLEPLQVRTGKGLYRFQVEMAVSHQQQETGMMCRRTVAADRGMLFTYPNPQRVAFWMRNTIIALDIIFIAPDGRVISIARSATPLSETPIPSGGVVGGVLELGGGRAEQIGLLPGDLVTQRTFPRG